VPAEQEIARVVPVIEALRDAPVPLSIDTRHAAVMEAALAAGASILNDVSALTHDPRSLAVAAASGVPIVLMHSLGDPTTMQDSPAYDDVLLDVFDTLEARIADCARAGIDRARLIADPGIGFGKTLAHNLEILRGLTIFHGLGCALMLGASRKSFIARSSAGEPPSDRLGGSLAAAAWGLARGIQILRVHDVAETAQAARVLRAIMGEPEETAAKN
jgi:dihydropteroate synthase